MFIIERGMNTFRPKWSILCLPKNLDVNSLYSVERSELEYKCIYISNSTGSSVISSLITSPIKEFYRVMPSIEVST